MCIKLISHQCYWKKRLLHLVKEKRRRWQTVPRPKEKLSARSSRSHLCDSQSLTFYARDLTGSLQK